MFGRKRAAQEAALAGLQTRFYRSQAEVYQRVIDRQAARLRAVEAAVANGSLTEVADALRGE